MTLKDQWKQEGIQQGMQDGLLTARKETALNFLSMGISVDKVVEGTGLKKAVILELKKTIAGVVHFQQI
jgi:predicted transposase YdaD